MANPFTFRLTPQQTPKTIKFILYATGFFSFLVPFLQVILVHISPSINLSSLFALSLPGIMHGYLWQLASFLFLEPVSLGFSFNFLLGLAFDLFLLWIVGTQLLTRLGNKIFFNVYFIIPLFSALIALAASYFFQVPGFLFGTKLALTGLITIWMMISSKSTTLFLFSFPVKVKWLALAFIGFSLFSNFSNWEILLLIGKTSTILLTYLYSVVFLKLSGPFNSLNPLEDKLKGFKLKKDDLDSPNAKIFDFKTGNAILSDEDFLDNMLDKIAKGGKASLTFFEKRRLKKISNKKRSSKMNL